MIQTPCFMARGMRCDGPNRNSYLQTRAPVMASRHATPCAAMDSARPPARPYSTRPTSPHSSVHKKHFLEVCVFRGCEFAFVSMGPQCKTKRNVRTVPFMCGARFSLIHNVNTSSNQRMPRQLTAVFMVLFHIVRFTRCDPVQSMGGAQGSSAKVFCLGRE